MTEITANGRLRATVSRGALAANLARLRASGHGGSADLRADAWGHGARFLSSVVTGATADGLLDNDRLLGLATGFEPVMTLWGKVLSTKPLRAGEGVSYGYSYRAPTETTVALVTGGYAQGIVRALGNRAEVLIEGFRHPIVGRVAMDVCVVELGTHIVPVGTDVQFLGAGLPVAQWADATGFGAGELITAVGLRAAREEVA